MCDDIWHSVKHFLWGPCLAPGRMPLIPCLGATLRKRCAGASSSDVPAEAAAAAALEHEADSASRLTPSPAVSGSMAPSPPPCPDNQLAVAGAKREECDSVTFVIKEELGSGSKRRRLIEAHGEEEELATVGIKQDEEL